MNIVGFQKFTTLDYPDTLAAIIFTYGCNFSCPFCHNPLLVLSNDNQQLPSSISEAEILEYLEKRKSVLQGLCISGGEPLLQTDIDAFISKVKNIGIKVKLDTNGCVPQKLRALVEKKLIDYVAVDIKNSPESYARTIGLSSFDISPILQTVSYLKTANIAYELRTTLVKELHTLEDLQSIGKNFGGNSTLYLQNFVRAEYIINDFTKQQQSLTPLNIEEINAAKAVLEKYFSTVIIR